MTPSGLEIIRALWGTLRLLRFDPSGLGFLDASRRGFWRSFFAAALVAPFYLFMLAVREDAWPDIPVLRFMGIEVVTYALSWLVFPVLMLQVVELLDRRRNYVRYIVAYNWSAVWQNGIYSLAALPAVLGLVGPEAAGMLTFAALAVIMLYGWFVARTGLDISPAAAFGVIFVDLIAGVVLSILTQTMLLS